MPELKLRVSPFFRQVLFEVLDPVERRLRLQLAVNPDTGPGEDEDLQRAWRESLLEQLRADAKVLRELLGFDSEKGVIALSRARAEALLRSAAAARLTIRESFLSRLTWEALESGEVDVNALGPDEHKPYACYVFLAGLQESLVAQLMPRG